MKKENKMIDPYIDGVLEHRRYVQSSLQKLREALKREPMTLPLVHVYNTLETRGCLHDASKLSPEERPGYEHLVPRLRTVVYGSPEYKAMLDEMGTALRHHYQENRHHPEHFERGVEEMHLVDIMEMVCDWVAAATRSSASRTIWQSLFHGKNRFMISDALYIAIEQTVSRYLVPHDVEATDPQSLIPLVILVCDLIAQHQGQCEPALAQLQQCGFERQLLSVLSNTVRWLSELTSF